MNKTIEYKKIRKLGACYGDRIIFYRTFGLSVRPNKKIVKQYYEKFSVTWAARNLLVPKASRQFFVYEVKINDAYLLKHRKNDKAFREKEISYKKWYRTLDKLYAEQDLAVALKFYDLYDANLI